MAQKQFKPATPAKASTQAAKPEQKGTGTGDIHFIFDRGNYRLLIIAVVVVAFGFILMSGTTDIYSTTKIVIAPLVVLGGFAIGFMAIFKKPSGS